MPRSHSVQRLRALRGAFMVTPEPEKDLTMTQSRVLLVDDYSETGWTLTVIARILRQVGATEAFPLVLALQG